jgi:hypothetical protein
MGAAWAKMPICDMLSPGVLIDSEPLSSSHIQTKIGGLPTAI